MLDSLLLFRRLPISFDDFSIDQDTNRANVERSRCYILHFAVKIGVVRTVATKTERNEVLIFQVQKLPHVEPSKHSALHYFKIVQLESLQVVQYDSL
jgi:hypothetical protein